MSRRAPTATVADMTAKTLASRTYIVECFAPGIHASALAGIGEAAAAAAEAVGTGARRVTYLGATLVPEDEVVFLHYRAASVEAVRAASASLPLPAARIVEAVAVGPGDTSSGSSSAEPGSPPTPAPDPPTGPEISRAITAAASVTPEGLAGSNQSPGD